MKLFFSVVLLGLAAGFHPQEDDEDSYQKGGVRGAAGSRHLNEVAALAAELAEIRADLEGLKTMLVQNGFISASPTASPSETPTISPSLSPSVSPSDLPSTSSAPTVTKEGIDFDFFSQSLDNCSPDDAGFSVNGNANFYKNDEFGLNCFLQLAFLNTGRGTAFREFNFAPSNTDGIFSAVVDYRITEYGTADGLAFFLHQDPAGEEMAEGGGGWLGYMNSNNINAQNVLAVELDTYNNGINSQFKDGFINEVSIMTTDEHGNPTELAGVGNVNIRTGSNVLGRLWVDYCEDGFLYVDVNRDRSKSRSDSTTVSTSVAFNPASFFDLSKPVYIGFGAGNSFENSRTEVADFTFTQELSSSCHAP